jgi:hypothetical protein
MDFAVCGKRATSFALEKDRSPLKWVDRRLRSARFLNAINRRSRRTYHARAQANGE